MQSLYIFSEAYSNTHRLLSVPSTITQCLTTYLNNSWVLCNDFLKYLNQELGDYYNRPIIIIFGFLALSIMIINSLRPKKENKLNVFTVPRWVVYIVCNLVPLFKSLCKHVSKNINEIFFFLLLSWLISVICRSVFSLPYYAGDGVFTISLFFSLLASFGLIVYIVSVLYNKIILKKDSKKIYIDCISNITFISFLWFSVIYLTFNWYVYPEFIGPALYSVYLYSYIEQITCAVLRSSPSLKPLNTIFKGITFQIDTSNWGSVYKVTKLPIGNKFLINMRYSKFRYNAFTNQKLPVDVTPKSGVLNEIKRLSEKPCSLDIVLEKCVEVSGEYRDNGDIPTNEIIDKRGVLTTSLSEYKINKKLPTSNVLDKETNLLEVPAYDVPKKRPKVPLPREPILEIPAYDGPNDMPKVHLPTKPDNDWLSFNKNRLSWYYHTSGKALVSCSELKLDSDIDMPDTPINMDTSNNNLPVPMARTGLKGGNPNTLNTSLVNPLYKILVDESPIKYPRGQFDVIKNLPRKKDLHRANIEVLHMYLYEILNGLDIISVSLAKKSGSVFLLYPENTGTFVKSVISVINSRLETSVDQLSDPSFTKLIANYVPWRNAYIRFVTGGVLEGRGRNHTHFDTLKIGKNLSKLENMAIPMVGYNPINGLPYGLDTDINLADPSNLAGPSNFAGPSNIAGPSTMNIAQTNPLNYTADPSIMNISNVNPVGNIFGPSSTGISTIESAGFGESSNYSDNTPDLQTINKIAIVNTKLDNLDTQLDNLSVTDTEVPSEMNDGLFTDTYDMFTRFQKAHYMSLHSGLTGKMDKYNKARFDVFNNQIGNEYYEIDVGFAEYNYMRKGLVNKILLERSRFVENFDTPCDSILLAREIQWVNKLFGIRELESHITFSFVDLAARYLAYQSLELARVEDAWKEFDSVRSSIQNPLEDFSISDWKDMMNSDTSEQIEFLVNKYGEDQLKYNFNMQDWPAKFVINALFDHDETLWLYKAYIKRQQKHCLNGLRELNRFGFNNRIRFYKNNNAPRFEMAKIRTPLDGESIRRT